MHHLVIVESPAKCKTIKKYLGKDYTVLASFGHIRDLPSKNGSVRPDDDFAMDYQVSSGSQKHVKAISDAVKGADSIILATDPDREGEAISWHVLETLRAKKALGKNTEIKRVAFSSITKKAVCAAMEEPRELDMNLVNSQQARRALDYLVGFNLSPVLWRKLPGSKSAGRVQSVALRIICDRESEIEAFRTEEYWDITGNFNSHKGKKFSGTLTHVEGKKLDKFALGNEKITSDVAANLADKKYTIEKVEKKQVKRHPSAPFTTSTLQQEASRKLGFSAKKTMQIAQRLYEGVNLGGESSGLITYMRTDGVTVATEAIFAARNLIEKEYGEKYLPKSPRMYKTKAKNAQEGHEAIRPTDPMRTPKQVSAYLDKDQLRLYDLIWKRLITSQMASVVMDQVSADITSTDGYGKFRAVGSTIHFDGFYRLYHEGKDDSSSDENGNKLPPLVEGTNAELLGLNPEQHFTQPPPRFTEASLVKKLEELGIGRPSTYASIISILQERDYVKLDKKRFTPEVKGRLVTAFLTSFFTKYVEYDFTAELENELDSISAGKLDWKKALHNFWGDFSGNVEEALKLEFTEVIDKLDDLLDPLLFPGDADRAERRKCPTCADGTLGLKLGKFGAFLGCSNYPECKSTTQLAGTGADGGSSGASVEPVVLGEDSETGKEVSLRKGPYGYYVQLGEAEGKDKPKRASLPKNEDPESIDLKKALSLLSLPRRLGKHSETGKVVSAGLGRFGPYLRYDGKFVSLKEDNVLEIELARAEEVIATAKIPKKVEPIRIIGAHPDDGANIEVFEGRYGPYVKHGKVNASIPKGQTIEGIELAEAVDLLAARALKTGKGKKKAPAKKKTAKKKKAAKKA